jgi:phosphatidylglycerol---prolipoprotein diacylglyceryl transferase
VHPVLFYLGPYPVFSYGVFVVLGLITLFAIGLTLARQAGWEWNHLVLSAFGMIAGGVFGGRLSHLIVEPNKLVALLDFYSLFGPVTPGNIVGMMVGAYVGGLVVRRSLELPSPGNYYAPAIAAASVMWRVGCTLGGCCYGKETNLPWAIHLSRSSEVLSTFGGPILSKNTGESAL